MDSIHPGNNRSRPVLYWLLRCAAWSLVLGCGFGLLTGAQSDPARSRLLTMGIWGGLLLYVAALGWDLIYRLRTVKRSAERGGDE